MQVHGVVVQLPPFVLDTETGERRDLGASKRLHVSVRRHTHGFSTISKHGFLRNHKLTRICAPQRAPSGLFSVPSVLSMVSPQPVLVGSSDGAAECRQQFILPQVPAAADDDGQSVTRTVPDGVNERVACGQ